MIVDRLATGVQRIRCEVRRPGRLPGLPCLHSSVDAAGHDLGARVYPESIHFAAFFGENTCDSIHERSDLVGCQLLGHKAVGNASRTSKYDIGSPTQPERYVPALGARRNPGSVYVVELAVECDAF